MEKIGVRDKTIDIAKGIGIIVVVWGHIGQDFILKNEIFLFHMPLFFLLSGYFFKDKGLTFIDVFKKRIQSYIIPYFVFFIIILLCFILLYVSIGYADKIYLSPKIIIQPYGVVRALWFLLSLFEVHIGYYFIAKYIRKEWIQSSICLSCLILSHIAFRCGVSLPLYIDSSLSMMIFFHIGYLMHKYRILDSLKYSLLLLVVCVLFYIAGIIGKIEIDVMVNKIEGNLLLAFLAAFGGAYIVLYVSLLLKKYNKISFINSTLTYLGRNTLTIFSMHLLCIEVARCLFKFPLSIDATILDGIYTTVWGILGSLIIGIPIKKYILPYIRIVR